MSTEAIAARARDSTPPSRRRAAGAGSAPNLSQCLKRALLKIQELELEQRRVAAVGRTRGSSCRGFMTKRRRHTAMMILTGQCSTTPRPQDSSWLRTTLRQGSGAAASPNRSRAQTPNPRHTTTHTRVRKHSTHARACACTYTRARARANTQHTRTHHPRITHIVLHNPGKIGFIL